MPIVDMKNVRQDHSSPAPGPKPEPEPETSECRCGDSPTDLTGISVGNLGDE